MKDEAILIGPETTWGTWVAPSLGFWVNKVSTKPAPEKESRRYPGKGRGVANTFDLGRMPSGSIEMDLYPEHFPMFLKAAAMSDIASTQVAATDAYEHWCLGDGLKIHKGLSMQVQRNGIAENIIGASISKMTVSMTASEIVTVAFDFLCKDIARTGKNWEDGTSAPSLITPITFVSSGLRPYVFKNAVLKIGGTPTFTDADNSYSVAGGTAIATFKSLEIAQDNGSQHEPTLDGDGTALLISTGDLDVNISGDVLWHDAATDFYDDMMENTPLLLEVTLTHEQEADADDDEYYDMVFVLPAVILDDGSLPDVELGSSSRQQRITGYAQADANGHEFAIKAKDTQTSY